MPLAAVYEHSSCEILITSSCNMVCTYCIAREIPSAHMDRDTGRKAIDLFLYLAQGCKTVELVFTGGEPLIEFQTFKYLLHYADSHIREAGMQPYYVLKTNGTILDNNIIKFLRTNSVKVVVSFDGAPCTHNKHRKTANGQGTQDVVMRNLGILRNNQVYCVASMTVHPDTVDEVLANVRFMHTLGIEELDVGPAYGTVSWSDSDSASFVQSLMDVAEYMHVQHTCGHQLEVGPLFRKSQHIDGVLSDQWGCHAGSSNLAFLPNGKIAGCSALAMIVSKFPALVLGDVVNGLDQLAVDRMLETAQAGREAREACKHCDVAKDCTGGCLAINYSTTGAPLLPPVFYCKTIAAISVGWCKAWGDH